MCLLDHIVQHHEEDVLERVRPLPAILRAGVGQRLDADAAASGDVTRAAIQPISISDMM